MPDNTSQNQQQQQSHEPQNQPQNNNGQEQQQQGNEPAGGGNIDIETIKQQVFKEFSQQLKEIVGVESLEDLRKKVEEEQRRKLEEEGRYKELLEKTEQEKLEIQKRYEDTVKQNTILSAASKFNFIDVETVLKLVKDFAVVKSDGSVEIDGLSVEDYLGKLAKEKPFLVKGSGKAGSGAPGEINNDLNSIQSYEDLLKDGKLLLEFKQKYPDRYQKLKDEYYKKKIIGG